MKQLQFLIKPAAGFCNMRCHYCFYRDEQQNRSTSEDCMMTLQTAETLIRRCFAELDQGGFVSFAFQGGEPTLAGLDFFRFFTQTVRKYNQKRVTVQYAIQTNGLAVAEEWARFFREENFLVGISLDGTPDVHDALRPDASGDGTWTRVMQTIKLLEQYHIECNLLCVVTKRLAKKAERVYKSMKATGVRYLQFIPCLDPLGEQRESKITLFRRNCMRNFCAPCLTHGIVTGKQVSMSVFACLKIIYNCSWAHQRELAPLPARAVLTWLWRAVALFTRAIFTVWTSTNSERFKMTLYNRCFWGRKCAPL